mmetsp:Transcript_117171/g.343229  ORF Transcript_117171/g.343229 Transcript_117171/m.343229 type:complete len:725 (+) Transcript_117171:59-2233(+)
MMHSAKPTARGARASPLDRPWCWAAVTVAVALAAYGTMRPDVCTDVAQCARMDAAMPKQFNAYAAYGLVMVLIGEMANLLSTFHGTRETQAMIPDLRSRCIPSLLLVISFLVLICEDTILAGSSPWSVNVRPDFQGPVYTATFVEWLINVPLLLVMAGHCALGRPLKELSRPVVMTNVYIIFAWMALVTTSSFLRWALIMVTFSMYGFASLDMVIWVANYVRVCPADLSSRKLRPCLSLGLIALFAVYACVFMAALLGSMPPATERAIYLVLNVASKLSFSIAFVVIRGHEYHLTLTGVLKKLNNSNGAVVSILRGSFDVLLPCVGDTKGHCKLPPADIGDMQQMELALHRPVRGLSLNDLLVDDTERARFAAYVLNAQRQSEEGKALGDVAQPNWTGIVQGQLPPVAQVLNCRFTMGSGAAQAGEALASMGCAVHLSVVPNSAQSYGRSYEAGRQMVAAVRFTESSAVSRPEEATSAPEFEAFEPGATPDATASLDRSENNTPGQIASLLDVAKLGMSALLRSARSASGYEEEESGYDMSGYDDEGSSYCPPVQQSSGPGSRTLINPTKRSATKSLEKVAEESKVFDSAVPVKTKSVADAQHVDAPSPKAPSSASTSISRRRPGQRLMNLLEPEEEHFSERSSDTSSKGKKTWGSTGGAVAVTGAVTGAVQELLKETELESDPQQNHSTLTVTMQISPTQFGVAVSTVALAAVVSIFSSKRRI